MKGSGSLKPVVQLAKHRERGAARQLGMTMMKTQQQQKQLDDLIAYRQQYTQGLQTEAAAGVSVVRVRDYHLFLNRLDDAINQQKQQLLNSHKDCENSKSHWQGAYGHSKMIDQIVDARKNIEMKKKDKSEQREMDDQSQVPSLLRVI